MSTAYDTGFYEGQQDGSYKSAQEIIPLLFEVYKPQSVLDVGCGLGTWLSVFKEMDHSTDVTGIDGDYVERPMLRIDADSFIPFDLTKTYKGDKKYALSMSLEVGEHLPEENSDNLVDTLTNSSDVVMFSAAIPGQIGTSHINEQYTEYWAKKFTQRGYTPVDYFRKRIWHNQNVEWWYKQNIILYIKNELYTSDFKATLNNYQQQTDPEFLTRIHPDMVNYFVNKFKQLSTYEGFARHKLYPIKKAFK